VPRTSDRGLGEDAEPRSSAVPGRFRPRRGRVVLVLVGLLCLIALLLAYQATRTVLALRQVKHDVDVLSSQVQHDNAQGAKTTLADLRDRAHTAHTSSSSFLWAGLTHLPWLGGDVDAVRRASSALDSASSKALPTALDLYSSLQRKKLRTADGRFDLNLISGLQAPLQRLGAELAPAQRDLAGIDPDTLKVGAVRTATRQFQSKLSSLTTLSQAGSTAARLLPGMLGAHGPRTYLLVVQNSAELRSTGGLPGSLLVLHTDRGKISLGQRFSALSIQSSGTPLLPVTAEEHRLYGDGLVEDVREANETPDYPRVGQFVDAFYHHSFGRHLDGVLATDPVALASLLRATGPISVSGETFSSDDVVRKLLNTTYLRFSDPSAQDAYFALAAKGIFDKLVARQVNQLSLVRALGTIASQRRFLVWSRHSDEQSALSGKTVSGALPRGRADGAWTGMYLNDATSSKMEYYLDYVGGVKPVSCTSDGTQRFETRLRLHSTAPADPSGLPAYVTGNGRYARKGSMKLSLRIYGPAGGKITGIIANGKERKPYLFTHDGHPVAFLSLLLKPQGNVDITAQVQTAAGQRGAPQLVWTPGVTTGDTSVSAPSTCS
jgi:hypothetical protein